jgi:hypothetical protein
MNSVTEEELFTANAKHLNYLETQRLVVAGINIFPVFTYELIQFLNNAYLRQRLTMPEAKAEVL